MQNKSSNNREFQNAIKWSRELIIRFTILGIQVARIRIMVQQIMRASRTMTKKGDVVSIVDLSCHNWRICPQYLLCKRRAINIKITLSHKHNHIGLWRQKEMWSSIIDLPCHNWRIWPQYLLCERRAINMKITLSHNHNVGIN